jgi:hypothetical protein
MFIDLSEFEEIATLYINGEGEYNPGDMDYFNGTGIPEGWTANVYGLTICVGSKEYTIPAKAMPAELVQHLSEKLENELNDHH